MPYSNVTYILVAMPYCTGPPRKLYLESRPMPSLIEGDVSELEWAELIVVNFIDDDDILPSSFPLLLYMLNPAPIWFWLSLCILATYCLLTVFQALMYFSMQFVKQPSSPLDSEVPGLGTQRSKQCSLSF